MISFFRQNLGSWPVKLFFLVLVAAFGAWGIGDVIRNMGRGGNQVATVGSQTVTPEQFQIAFQNGMSQLTRRLGAMQPTDEMRQSVAQQVLVQVVSQAALADEAHRLGVAVPDSAIRDEIAGIPAFQDKDGRYSVDVARDVLRSNRMTEAQLQTLVRDGLIDKQILGAAQAGTAAPEALTNRLIAYRDEQRSADLVTLPFADATPPKPTDAQLHRWYDLHPDIYSTPAYRHVRTVVLSAETIAKSIDVPDTELQAAYDAQKATFVQPEKRSAQIATLADEAKARALATAWRAGADWARVQADAAAGGGSAVALDESSAAEFPGDALGKAVFAAAAGTVADPVKDDLGWHVVKVTKITPPLDRTFDQVKDQLREQIAAEQAASQVYDRSNKLDNLLAAGTSFDELPGDLGLAGVSGTLDEKGNTPDATPAPIPGPREVRDAIVAEAFKVALNATPEMKTVTLPGGGEAGYAVIVDSETPPSAKAYQDVAAQVADDWARDARRHAQDAKAASVLAAVQAGTPIADAAKAAGAPAPVRTGPSTREKAADGVDAALADRLFTMKRGEATMQETPTGFVVAVLADVTTPDPNANPAMAAQMRVTLARAIAGDVSGAFGAAVRDAARPQVNQRLVDQIVGH